MRQSDVPPRPAKAPVPSAMISANAVTMTQRLRKSRHDQRSHNRRLPLMPTTRSPTELAGLPPATRRRPVGDNAPAGHLDDAIRYARDLTVVRHHEHGFADRRLLPQQLEDL